jgi:arginase
MPNKILPVPFAESVYGHTSAYTYKRILNIKAANENLTNHFPSSVINDNCTILEPIAFENYPDDEPEKGSFFKSNLSLATNLANRIEQEFDFKNDKLCIIGGDHSISAGTGAGLSRITNLSKVGLIYVDTHGDFNTPESSQSKCMTGYPCAVTTGLGVQEFTNLYSGNFIQKVVQIGIRDIDVLEKNNLDIQKVTTYSIIELEALGIAHVMKETLAYLSDCDYIWLSIDVDCLDAVYLQHGETDVPTFAGLTPRELVYITHTTESTNKLKVFEITQLNDMGHNTDLTIMSSRLIELAFGIGKYRYNHN